MVCLGNICRSPLAQGIMDRLASERGLAIDTDSAGTSGWHVGEKPHNDSILVASQHGIDISCQRSRQFVPLDFERFDLILAMDESNKRYILRLINNKEDEKKIHLLLNFHPDEKNVPDPYYEGGFGGVFDLITTGCEQWIDHIEKKQM